MAFKHCPSPEYDKSPCISTDKPGQTFEGSLVYIASPAKGLVYCINHAMFDEFTQIEEFQPKNAYKSPPSFGNTFIWYDKVRKSSYRAYRLNSSSADAYSIKSFLFDIGEIKYERFNPSKYFEIPLNFLRLPPLGLCCIVESFPNPTGDCLKSDFFNESRLGQSFSFTVQRKGIVINSIGFEEKCLVVDIENSGDDSDEELQDLPDLQPPPGDVDHFRPLTYQHDSGGGHVPFLFSQIPSVADWPQPGSKIMVHIMEIGTRCVHAKCNTQDSFAEEKLVSEFMSLQMWMNQPEVIKEYQKFDVPLVKDEVALFQEKNGRIFRAVVKNVLGTFFQIFLFDAGKNLTIHGDRLKKFPVEFGTMPKRSNRLRVASLEKLNDELRIDAIATIRFYRDSIRLAQVIASSQQELLVDLYDYEGIDVMELMQMRIRDQLAVADN